MCSRTLHAAAYLSITAILIDPFFASMSSRQETFATSNVYEGSPLNPQQAHHYDNVNLSGNASAVLGNVYHYHNFQQKQDLHPERGDLRSILTHLAYSDMLSRFRTLDDPYPDTFKWILSPLKDADQVLEKQSVETKSPCWDSFTDWLKDGSTPYWISGKLGTGKSTLMKFILESLSGSQSGYGETQDNFIISHFFWAPGSSLQNSVVGCLRSLLWQLLQLGDERCHMVDPANVASIGRLRNNIITTIDNIQKPVLVLLDGLDECGETEDILDLVETLAALPHVRLCVSSRQDEVFLVQFSDFAKLRLQDLNKHDIQFYVQTQMLNSPRFRRSPSWNAKVAQDLANSVIENAEGVFLWVRLVIKELFRGWTNRDDLSRMQQRLQKLPQDVYNLYTQLTRRRQEDGLEYMREAAMYYQLLAQSSSQKLSLATFLFATHETIRARYLKVDEVFDLPVTELERDVDLETLVTWINVRTGGLLEVKEDKDIFSFCIPHRPGPSGKFMRFHEHWVGFIHRSAYTYLQDTLDGQEIMKKLPMTVERLSSIYFESQVATLLIVPGTYRFRFAVLEDFNPLFPLPEFQSCSIQLWCEVLQRACNSLLVHDLMITTKDFFHAEPGALFPSSVYQSVDLCMLFTVCGSTKIAELFAQQYGCQEDDHYMSEIRLAFVKTQSRTQRGVKEDDVSLLVQSLKSQTARLKSTDFLQSKEESSFSVRIGELMPCLNWRAAVHPNRIWEVLEASNSIFPALLPLSRSLIDFHMFRNSAGENDLFVCMALSINTSRNFSEAHALDQPSNYDQALFFQRFGSGIEDYRMIHQDDSHEVLKNIGRILSSQLGKEANDPDYFIHKFRVDDEGHCCFLGRYNSVLSRGLAEIYGRSPQVDCFVECLRRIGKTEEIIYHTISEEVRVAAHFNWTGCDQVDTRDCDFFHRLLGSDPGVLASWIQKFPALKDCPGILPE